MLKNRHIKIDRAKKDRIIRAYRKGESLRKISLDHGVSFVTINKYLSRWGVKRRTGERRRSLLVNDLIGKRFGKLMVLYRDDHLYPVKWVVQCDCGTITSMFAYHLKSRRSCGCMRGRMKAEPGETQ